MVFLVPAHGPNNVTEGQRDPGAIGSGTDEAAVSADLTADVAQFLDAFTDVTLVPSGTLNERVAWLVEHMRPDDWAFSLHMNSGGGTGTEVIYDDQKPGLRDEAAQLSQLIATGLGLADRGAKPDTSTPRNYLGLVSRPSGRVFIVETAFQDRPSDVAAVQSNGPRVVAEAIRTVMGIPAPSEHAKPAPAFVPTKEQQEAYDFCMNAGIYTDKTPRNAPVTTEMLSVYLKRAADKGLLNPPTA